jgi:hypothetical protein
MIRCSKNIQLLFLKIPALKGGAIHPYRIKIAGKKLDVNNS